MTRFCAAIGAALALVLGGSAVAEASELIARLQPGADAAAIAASDGVILQDQTPNAPFALFSVAPGGSAAAAQAALQADPRVVWAEDNVDISTTEDQGIGRSTPSKGGSLSVIGGRDDLQAINHNALSQVNWSSTLADSPGRTVRIAILDTGLSLRRRALWAKVDASFSAIAGSPVANDIGTRTDSNGDGIVDGALGHGTMVAGIIDQVAPQVRFVIAKISDSDGQATAWTLTEGLAFAVVNHAEVANLSLGSLSPIAAISDVADYCEENNLLVVAAIGNGAQGNADFPSRFSKVVCVAGLNADSTKASFSNWDGGCDSAAPGVGIASQFWDGGTASWSGTSFAAPFVSGAIADCLRRLDVAPVARVTLQAVSDSGSDLDHLNPNFRGKLGTLLNIVNLDAKLQSGAHGGGGGAHAIPGGGRGGGKGG